MNSNSASYYVFPIAMVCFLFSAKVLSYEYACGFSEKNLSFAGTPLQQANCLLKQITIGGDLAKTSPSLPPHLKSLIGNKVSIDKSKIIKYFSDNNISDTAVGGSITESLSHSSEGSKPVARYFVIHDVSYNVCDKKEKLHNTDSPSAEWNLSKTWENSTQAHLYITRDGKFLSPQGRTFATPWRATQLELDKVGKPSMGLFLHVENIQVRTAAYPPGGIYWVKKKNKNGRVYIDCENDRIAQTPGFTDIQLSRLALAYIIASYRKGSWLIPAYHANIDRGISGGHDDPQNFDLDKWSNNICSILTELNSPDCKM
ncbi:hypothetical protein RM352_002162 [Enterobacter kobei]|nr:hypothetical protein [Enterobacter kobei]